MRRSTLDLIRCPKCLAGSLVPDGQHRGALVFGPVRCVGCQARFPVNEGFIDLVLEKPAQAAAQRAMELPWVARAWERSIRPALGSLLTLGKLADESEYEHIRSLVGTPQGPVFDLGSGGGALVRRLARDLGQPVVGIDLSLPMIEEAIAQSREHGVTAEFIRASTPPLPLLNASAGALVAIGFVHFFENLGPVFREVARVLKPKGRFVASTWQPNPALKLVHQSAGLSPRSEETLRDLCRAAGLIGFECVKAGPLILWKVELP